MPIRGMTNIAFAGAEPLPVPEYSGTASRSAPKRLGYDILTIETMYYLQKCMAKIIHSASGNAVVDHKVDYGLLLPSLLILLPLLVLVR